MGVSKSRNKGIKKSKGKYIAFIDGDDIWKKEKLKTQFQFMEKNNYMISHTDYEIINETDKLIGRMPIKKILDYKDLIYSCDIGLSTVMVSSKIKSIIKFPDITTKEDYILWLRLSKSSKYMNPKKSNLMEKK